MNETILREWRGEKSTPSQDEIPLDRGNTRQKLEWQISVLRKEGKTFNASIIENLIKLIDEKGK